MCIRRYSWASHGTGNRSFQRLGKKRCFIAQIIHRHQKELCRLCRVCRLCRQASHRSSSRSPDSVIVSFSQPARVTVAAGGPVSGFCCFLEVTMSAVKPVSDGLRDCESETQLNLLPHPAPQDLSRPLASQPARMYPPHMTHMYSPPHMAPGIAAGPWPPETARMPCLQTFVSLLCVAARRATRPNGEWGYSTRRHMLEPVRREAVLPDRALCLPTFSHFLIVNKTSLSLSLSLPPPPSLSLAW